MRVTTRTVPVIILCGLLGLAIADRARISSAHASEGAQDAAYLDRRISTLEIRLGTIESSLRSLERQSMNSRMTDTQPVRDPETSLIRSELELLQGRLREMECGLVHLDQRTLSVAAREALKRSSGQATDPCRSNPEAPLIMSPRR